jgi:hypothetical protein
MKGIGAEDVGEGRASPAGRWSLPEQPHRKIARAAAGTTRSRVIPDIMSECGAGCESETWYQFPPGNAKIATFLEKFPFLWVSHILSEKPQ